MSLSSGAADGMSMTSSDSGATLAELFRSHAGTSTHLYGFAMRGMAEDWEAGGPVRAVCAGYEQAPPEAFVQLRLLAALFRTVLTDRAPALVPFYPVLGGTADPALAWPVMRQVIAEHVPELRTGLLRVPQTNEVGRSAALLAGLFDLVEASGLRRLRLLEFGASAGLNLLVDAYGYAGDGWTWGRAASPVQLDGAVLGEVRPQAFELVTRRGCDLDPVDPSTAEGRLLLTSFVWPFDLARHVRLAAALEVAVADPPPVDRAPASAWLAEQLAVDHGADHLPAGVHESQVLTVVWQSVTQLYWPAEELAAVRQLLDRHGAQTTLGHVALEPEDGAAPADWPVLTTTLWRPGTSHPVRRRRLGTVHHHGIPVQLSGEP